MRWSTLVVMTLVMLLAACQPQSAEPNSSAAIQTDTGGSAAGDFGGELNSSCKFRC